MADITMCKNKKCKKKKKCYRYIATPDNLYQSYFLPNENNCKYFIQATQNEMKGKKTYEIHN